MRYMIDTANIEEIKDIIEFFPIEGVTTNPTLVSKEKMDFKTLVTGIRDVIGPDRVFFVQLRGDTAEEMVEEARALKKLIGDNYVAKIPMGRAGLKAVMTLSKEMPCCVTAICSRQQAMLAARAGASFVAPYVNRLDNIGASGVEIACDIAGMLDHYGLPCEVVGASFKNVDQVQECAMGGCHVVTLKAEMFDMLAGHPLTDSGIAGFDKDWKAFYGENKILDLLK